jgi:hypothetical protein
MKSEYYTSDGQHPDDAISKVKDFINELSNVQEQYFNGLVDELRLTTEGADWLFDYIYNSGDEGKYLTFEEHISFYKKTYDELVKQN